MWNLENIEVEKELSISQEWPMNDGQEEALNRGLQMKSTDEAYR